MLQDADSTVATLMSRDVVTVPEDATIGDAAELIVGFDVSGLPVVDDDGAISGVLSETDLVRFRSGAPPWRSWHALLVRDLMTSPAVVVAADTPVHEAARAMADMRIHRLFVVDADGAPIGVVSERDVIAEIADMDA
jgi:CBS domain-containing protein